MRTTTRSGALVFLLRPAAWRWTGLGCIVAISTALSLGSPLIVRRIIDQAAAGAGAGQVRGLALLFLAVVITGQAAAIWVARAATATAWETTNRLRMQMTEHVLSLDHEFHRGHTPGELISRVDGDVTYVSDFLSKVVTKALGAVLLVAGMIGVLAVLDWRLGAAMVAYVGTSLSVVLRTRHYAVTEAADEMGSNARLYGGIEERLNALEDIRSAGAGNHAMWRFVEDSAGVMNTSVRRESAFMGMWWAVQGSLVIGTVAAIGGGAFLASRGSITIGTAFLLFQYVRLMNQPLEEVVHELETVQKASGAMVRVIDLHQILPSVTDAGTTSPRPDALAVSFDNVSFDYGDADGAAPVLTDVDLTISAGRSVGIIGRTGSGKTTFSRLVLRLVEATGGTVRLGDVPIDDIPMTELRSRVALVPQEVELLGGSVRDNVTLFDPEPTDEAVEAALRGVGLDVLVDGGIDRDLGAGGSGLSAGEAQLLAMARVWMRDPDLVVLDEATARVDPDTERRLEAAVHALMEGRTTLVIAHRLSTLREVDDILMFDHGRVVEFGARAELAADPSSRYSRLLTIALEESADLGRVTI